MDLIFYPSTLKGSVIVPPSKSITHRHLICAALSKKKSIIHNPLISDDTLATIDVLKQLGAKFKFYNDKIVVKGCGIPKVKERTLTILESATTLRILLPILVLFSSKITINSTKRLIDRIHTSDLLDLRGLDFQRKDHSIIITGNLTDKEIELSGKITTQLISGVLLALPYLEDTSLSIHHTDFENPYLELTLDAMRKFGILYEITDNKIRVEKNSKYISRESYIEGDFSNGAVWLVAGCFHRDLKISGLNMESFQGDRKIIDYLKLMGIEFSYIDNVFSYKSGELASTTINVDETPDLAPILVAVASVASGTIIIEGTSKLKYKESNRKKAISEVVNLLGGNVNLEGDKIIITGRSKFKGATELSAYNDHRIVMASAILASIAREPVVLRDFQVVNKSYPNFFIDLANVGAKFEVI